MEPALPALPGRGGFRPAGVRRPCDAHRVRRPVVARGVQRHLPADRRHPDGGARLPLAVVPGGPGGPTAGRRRRCRADQLWCRSTSRPVSISSRSRPRTRTRSRSCCPNSASRSAGSTAPSLSGSGRPVAPASCSTSSRPGTGNRPSRPSASRSPIRRRRPDGPPSSRHHRSSGGPVPRSTSCALVAAPDGTEIFWAEAGVDTPIWAAEFDEGTDAGGRQRDQPHRPHQPVASVAPVRRGRAVLRQRAGPAVALDGRSRRSGRAGTQPGDADQRWRGPFGPQRRPADGGRPGRPTSGAARRIRLFRRLRRGSGRPRPAAWTS